MNNYNQWIMQREYSDNDLYFQKTNSIFKYKPKISIIIPTYNTNLKYLTEALDSVINQTYSNWEICIGDGSDKVDVKDLICKYQKVYKNIKASFLSENKGIIGNSNEAIRNATGDFITFLDHDDTLAPFALFEVVKELNNDSSFDILYSNEDKITKDGIRCNPHFKPAWSPDTLRSYNYICHLAVYRTSLIKELGGLSSGFEGAQDYDLILRASEKTDKIHHINKILYHWRMIPGSTALDGNNKPYAFEAGRSAVQAHVKRVLGSAFVSEGLFPGSYEVKYMMKETPLVSVIIPNKNNYSTLKTCLDSIFKNTYKNYEIIILENGSVNKDICDYYNILSKVDNVKIVEWKKDYFNYSEINNWGTSFASGDYFLFLNNDIQAINDDWLERMMEFIVRKDVGVVGAKLYYPNDTLQHVGVMVGMGGIAGHPFCKAQKDSLGYMGRAKIIQNLTAVTGACLLTKKAVFNEVGGFDEKLVLAFNDVDYSCASSSRGYRTVWTPYAELYHHESLTRGYEDTPEKKERFWNEAKYFQQKWVKLLKSGDPYYWRD